MHAGFGYSKASADLHLTDLREFPFQRAKYRRFHVSALHTTYGNVLYMKFDFYAINVNRYFIQDMVLTSFYTIDHVK